MTTLSPTMTSLLSDLAKVTKARRDNWNGRDEPQNPALEASHLQEMARIKQAIEGEENETSAATGSERKDHE